MEKTAIDYATLQKIIRWSYNFRHPDEALTKEMFIKHMSQNPLHYYEKFTNVFRCNVWEMMAYFSHDIKEGQEFCDMMMVQVEKYQQRISKK